MSINYKYKPYKYKPKYRYKPNYSLIHALIEKAMLKSLKRTDPMYEYQDDSNVSPINKRFLEYDIDDFSDEDTKNIVTIDLDLLANTISKHGRKGPNYNIDKINEYSLFGLRSKRFRRSRKKIKV